MPRLIVNADDFGLTPGINRAILDLHTAGVLTSATLMATGPALGHAVALAHAHPTLGVGCHVVLTDGLPASPPQDIPTLLGDDGRSFRPSLQHFLLAVIRGKVHPAELHREIIAQVRILQGAGIPVTHLDTHKHTHVLPAVARALLSAAEVTGIPAVRSPFEALWSLRLGQPLSLRLAAVAGTRLLRRRFLALAQLRTHTVHTTDGTLGISATGRLDEPTLRQLLAALPEGTWELVCHPGYNDRDLDAVTTRLRHTREIELRALLAVLSPLAKGRTAQKDAHPTPLELIHYGELRDYEEPRD